MVFLCMTVLYREFPQGLFHLYVVCTLWCFLSQHLHSCVGACTAMQHDGCGSSVM
jgi:hypothetical protein